MKHLNLFEDFEDFQDQKSYFNSIIPDSEINEIKTKEDLLDFFKRHANNPEEFVIALIKTNNLMRPGGKFHYLIQDPDYIDNFNEIIYNLPGGINAIKREISKIAIKFNIKFKLESPSEPESEPEIFEPIDNKTEEEELRNMSQRDIMKLIDVALDNRDFDRVSKLRRYLESKYTFYPKHLVLFENFFK